MPFFIWPILDPLGRIKHFFPTPQFAFLTVDVLVVQNFFKSTYTRRRLIFFKVVRKILGIPKSNIKYNLSDVVHFLTKADFESLKTSFAIDQQPAWSKGILSNFIFATILRTHAAAPHEFVFQLQMLLRVHKK